METLKLPKGALRLVANDCHAYIEMAKDGDVESPTLRMTVYSGGLIEGHWYWGKLAIDLEGVKFDRSKYPILENHMTSRKIGYSGKPVINGSITLDPDNVVFVETDASEEFIKLAKQGFPYQSSLYAIPMRLERIEEGASVKVNGFNFKGPGMIWRECLYQESSICVFGWDKKTEATVFSREETEIKVEHVIPETELDEIDNENKQTKGGEDMKLEELMKDHPDLVKQIEDAKAEELEAEFSQEKVTLTDAINVLDQKVEEGEKRNLALEKKDTLREEREMQARADQIWTTKLAESEVAEHLYDKIRKHAAHGKFVKDEILDEKAFSEAIDAEIKDWEQRGATQKVMGSGSLDRSDTSEDSPSKEEEKEIQEETDELLKLVGQEKKEATT